MACTSAVPITGSRLGAVMRRSKVVTAAPPTASTRET